MLLKDHLSLPPSFLPCFIDVVWVTGSSDSSQFTVGLCCSHHICHALISSINPTLGDWKPRRQQDLKRETSLFFHSARTTKHLFRAEQWYRYSPNSSWPSWNSEEEEAGSYSPLCTGFAIIKYLAVLQLEGSRTCKCYRPKFLEFNEYLACHFIPFSGKKLGNSSEVSHAETSVCQVTCCVKLA